MNLDEIQNEIEKLSAADWHYLFGRLLLTANVAQWKSPEAFTMIREEGRLKIEGAEIRIQDWQGQYRRKPRIVIRYENGVEEDIDIISKLKEGTTSIGHPAILLAINRWREIIRCHSALARARFIKPSHYENFSKIAEDHLKQVARAFIEGAKSHAIPVEDSLYVMQYGWAMNYDYYVLRWVWELLARDEVRTKRNASVKLDALKKLITEEVNSNPPLSEVGLSNVLHFLDCAGMKCLEKRPSWRVMRAEFDRWRFGLGGYTIKKYRRRSKFRRSQKGYDMRFIRPDLVGDFFISELSSLLAPVDSGAKNNSP